jgi:two-component system, response regulator RegA
MKGLSVLLVDDENRLREALSRAIASWGFEVGEARSAEEAMRVMQGKAFDISILDLNLPGMGGIELFEKFRGINPRHQVIVLSGFGNLEAARAAIRLDVVDFLEKPCHLGELEQSLHRATQRIRSVGEVEEEKEVVVKTEGAEVGSGADVTLQSVERQHILQSLARNGGNRTATAAELGISRRTLQYKLLEYARDGFAVD